MTLWTPLLESNTGIWDPTDTATITSSGGLVSAISTKSGTAPSLTQSTGSLQPSTGTRTLNSLNVIDTDGTNYLASTITFPTSGNYMFVGVFGVDAVTNSLQAIFATGGTNFFAVDAGSGSQFNARLNGTNTFTTATPSPAVNYNSATIYVVVFNFDSSTVKLYTNGSLVLTVTYLAKITSPQQLGVFVDKLGTHAIDGFMGYMAICNTITDYTRQRFEGYLANKFALQSGLPSTHPYKANAPKLLGESGLGLSLGFTV